MFYCVFCLAFFEVFYSFFPSAFPSALLSHFSCYSPVHPRDFLVAHFFIQSMFLFSFCSSSSAADICKHRCRGFLLHCQFVLPLVGGRKICEEMGIIYVFVVVFHLGLELRKPQCCYPF
ncbi:hypothetical protein BX661DRAFT_184225 [Kickxella alabastrina]|uniref:uncharacterized protein n=1 Tax=Kickxella alabastrina TaxID=61397 RepID=UPI00221E5D34|nr:uncharacterized protein BX661DRAFT_184225 [Kickxella alabastrina]KAI7825821.1 hypothetical protein BX661DRAFT_184225 [Kickxella alabastrina]